MTTRQSSLPDMGIDGDFYDQGYFDGTKGQYSGYDEHARPHWSKPLALLIANTTPAPARVLDVGTAFGFLVRDLQSVGVAAQGVEWSRYCLEHSVAPAGSVQWMDGRELRFPDATFDAVVSLDFLEHLNEDGIMRSMDEMLRLLPSGGMLYQLIGTEDVAVPHESTQEERTGNGHLWYARLDWYAAQFIRRGVERLPDLEAGFNTHPAWSWSDWVGRWFIGRKR